MCCGEGLSLESFKLRPKDSSYNFGLRYKFKDYGNVDISFIKGNTWNLSFSIGFSSKKPLFVKNKFEPKVIDKNYNENKKNEFYLDLLDNLNANKLYLQSANIAQKKLEISIDSESHINPIRYSNEASQIANYVAASNDYSFDQISVSHITRGIQINEITFFTDNIQNKYKPTSLIKRENAITNPKFI